MLKSHLVQKWIQQSEKKRAHYSPYTADAEDTQQHFPPTAVNILEYSSTCACWFVPDGEDRDGHLAVTESLRYLKPARFSCIQHIV